MKDTDTRPKLHFVQWLRVFLIALVVAHHAGQPYGPTGGAWPVSDPTNSDLLLPFFAVNAAYFMGFFFLISGYFLEGSYDRRGALAFIGSKLVRLGLPLVVIVVFVNGLVTYSGAPTTRGYLGFLWHDYLGGQMEFGPLWFVAHLLIYAGLYALWRWIAPRHGPVSSPRVPGHAAIAAYTLGLIVVTYAVRQIWPQDVWVRLLWFVPLEPMHLPQYASLFVIGVVAARGDWFTRLPKRVAYTWFWIAVLVFFVAVGLVAAEPSLPSWIDAREFWSLGDSVICVGMILGLLAFFRAHLDRTGPWVKRLAASTYGIYLIHVYVVVAVQTPLVDTSLGPLTKFAIATVAGFVLSFVVIDTLRRLRPIRAVI